MVGKGVLLDGVDDILVASQVSLSLNASEHFSFETWLKVDTDLTQMNTTYTLAGNRTLDAGFSIGITGGSASPDQGRILFQTHTQNLMTEATNIGDGP